MTNAERLHNKAASAALEADYYLRQARFRAEQGLDALATHNNEVAWHCVKDASFYSEHAAMSEGKAGVFPGLSS